MLCYSLQELLHLRVPEVLARVVQVLIHVHQRPARVQPRPSSLPTAAAAAERASESRQPLLLHLQGRGAAPSPAILDVRLDFGHTST